MEPTIKHPFLNVCSTNCPGLQHLSWIHAGSQLAILQKPGHCPLFDVHIDNKQCMLYCIVGMAPARPHSGLYWDAKVEHIYTKDKPLAIMIITSEEEPISGRKFYHFHTLNNVVHIRF